jgi:predicted PurR-regulated permease PerM
MSGEDPQPGHRVLERDPLEAEPGDPVEAPLPEEAELAGEEDAPQPPQRRTVIPRWVQLATLPIALIATWGLIALAGKVVLIFILGGLIALILNPVVDLLHRGRLPRGLAVLGVYLGFFIVTAGVVVLLANPISGQINSFSRAAPTIVKNANHTLADTQSYLNKHGLHVHLIKQGQTALQTL